MGSTRRMAVVAVVVFAAAGTLYVHHRDQLRREPAYAAVPTTTSRTCPPSDGLGDPPVTARLWVDPDPDGGVALWLPGMNDRCTTVLTRLAANQARAFAEAVEQGKELPSGAFACPNDDGSAVTVFLTYPGRSDAEVVRVRLAGCGGVSAPGREGLDAGVLDALRPFPARWR